ncbi:hypothetical protein Tco_0747712 [Tanacetum coccineum]|uniref:Uncharacterized protein n=1 Tax=Tanacetum coccineum TaxID=301880 RepID=A0ABQ4YUG3_9ASTR
MMKPLKMILPTRRSLFHEEGPEKANEVFKKKASTKTETIHSEVTPMKSSKDQEGSGKRQGMKFSNCCLKKREEEPKQEIKEGNLNEERNTLSEAIRLEEQMNEEQRAQIARDAEIARQWHEEERKRAMDEAKTTKNIDWNDPSVIR